MLTSKVYVGMSGRDSWKDRKTGAPGVSARGMAISWNLSVSLMETTGFHHVGAEWTPTHVKTQAVSPTDLQALIRNLYYARSQNGRQNHWLSSLDKFCQHRRQLPPIEEEPMPIEPTLNENGPSRWDPEWTRWLTRQNVFGNQPRKPKQAKRRPRKAQPGRTKRKGNSDKYGPLWSQSLQQQMTPLSDSWYISVLTGSD